MQKLQISNFSCIKSASIETSGLTILIGPQASGKSVISKLIYFFNRQLENFPAAAEEKLSSSDLETRISDEFSKWFPVSAWGDGRFKIMFEAGPFVMSIQRTKRDSKRARVLLSSDVRVYYDTLTIAYEELSTNLSNGYSFSSTLPFQIFDRLNRSNSERLDALLTTAYVKNQIFIPAARSWFTSIGKSLTAFERGGILDEVTLNFGRAFANAQEYIRSTAIDPNLTNRADRFKDLANQLFGGQLRFEREGEYVQASDGRKIPFNILSSGQQELLPLWLVLIFFSTASQSRRVYRGRNLIYIEEPEAHLFPVAQSLLLEFLVGLTTDDQLNHDMLITTHSPYILSKINILLKAGAVGELSEAKANQVSEILPRSSWLSLARTKAYAIIDGKVRDIVDEDGLIDGEYLDSISNEISTSFNQLLEIEFAE